MPVVTGGTQTVSSQNGNYQIHTSVLKPDGQVVHSHQSGKFPKTSEKNDKKKENEKKEEKKEGKKE